MPRPEEGVPDVDEIQAKQRSAGAAVAIYLVILYDESLFNNYSDSGGDGGSTIKRIMYAPRVLTDHHGSLNNKMQNNDEAAHAVVCIRPSFEYRHSGIP